MKMGCKAKFQKKIELNSVEIRITLKKTFHSIKIHHMEELFETSEKLFLTPRFWRKKIYAIKTEEQDG